MSVRDVEEQWRALVFGRDERLMADVDPLRQRLYRRLVRNSVSGNIRRAVPHARRIAGADTIDALIARYLDEAGPQTRFFRQVPVEFAAWLMSAEPGPLAELVHWETLEVDVLLAPDALPAVLGRVPLDDAEIVTHPSARLAAYRHPVHRVDASSTALPSPAAEPVLLLAWRDGERFASECIDGGVAKLLVECAQGATIGAGLAAIEAGLAPGDVLDRARTKASLVSLQRRGALLGFAC